MTKDEVDALRKGVKLRGPNGGEYVVLKVAGLKHANLRYRRIWLLPVGRDDEAKFYYDGDQLVGRGWEVLS